jgi:16S rRNA (guanine966-N2)-methyltransferase
LAHADFAGGAPEEMAVLDVFAGCGVLGLEALSRGAAQVTFIEQAAVAVRAIEQNIATLGEAARTSVLRRDATRPGPVPANGPFDLLLMDAPYRAGLSEPALAALAAGGWLADGALVVVELAAKEPLDLPEGFAELDARSYGAARVVFATWRR